MLGVLLGVITKISIIINGKTSCSEIPAVKMGCFFGDYVWQTVTSTDGRDAVRVQCAFNMMGLKRRSMCLDYFT